MLQSHDESIISEFDHYGPHVSPLLSSQHSAYQLDYRAATHTAIRQHGVDLNFLLSYLIFIQSDKTVSFDKVTYNVSLIVYLMTASELMKLNILNTVI